MCPIMDCQGFLEQRDKKETQVRWISEKKGLLKEIYGHRIIFVFVSGSPGLSGFPGRPGPPGKPSEFLISGLVGDPGLPGLDGNYGKNVSMIQFSMFRPPFSLCNTLSSLLQVFRVPQVPPDHLVQGQHRGTQVTQDSRASQDSLAIKESQEYVEILETLATLVSKVK